MRQLAVAALIVFLSGNASPAGNGEKYHQVFIPDASPGAIRILGELGLPLDDAISGKEGGMEIPLRDSEIALLKNRGISYRIVQEDLEKYYAEICADNLKHIPPYRDTDPVHMKYGSMGGFYTFQQIVADLDSMRFLYPNLCTAKTVIGNGWNQNPIYMVKISDNPDLNEDEPEALFDALHHAREASAYTATLYAMWYLLENYGTDPEITYLVDNRELYFVPVVNPDGLLYNQTTNPNGGGMWRKNRRNNGGSYGVDLNRNYPYQWGYDNVGSSPTPSSETYRGPSAGSEPETQAMMAFINSHDIKTAMTTHTYGEKYLCAYGYANVQPEFYDVHMDYMGFAAQNNGYAFGYCYAIQYASNGRTQDWQLHQHKIINVEPEIGGQGFWPSITYIMPEAAENLNCFLNQAWCAGGQVVLTSLAVQDGYLTPGQTENLIVTLFNRGWGMSEAITYEVTESDPYITLTNASAAASPLQRRTSVDNSAAPFSAIVAPNCPIGHEVQFTVLIHQGSYTRSSVVSRLVGEPTVFFSDNAESGLSNWTISNSWGLDSNSPHGGVYSFSDSPGRNYYNNANAVMTLLQPINLSSATVAWLDFWTRWDIEAGWDFGQVEVSTNGSTWTPIAGLYTEPGSGQGQQPAGQPGYDGSQLTWVHEFMDLTPYAGQSYFKFRFEFKSDGGVVGDGWYIDDLKLLGFTEIMPPPNVTITLTPISPPIQIPATGGSFDFDVTVANGETTVQTFDAWIMVQLPNLNWYGPVLGPINLTLPGGASITRTRTQAVPASAPAGNYLYEGRVGTYPATIWDTGSFPFTKLSTGDGLPVSGWENSGESFDATVPVSAPAEFALIGAYPNPFNPSTTISFALPTATRVTLNVYDISGRQVADLAGGWKEAGVYEVTFDAASLTSGLYFCRLRAGSFEDVKKILLMK